MSGLYFDVFPADDPNGAALGELTEAYDKSYQGVHQAIGSGQFTVNRSSSQASWAVADNLVRVRRVAGGPFSYDDSRYIGAFWIESGKRVLLSEAEEGGRDLTMGGRGPEAALRWAILYPDAFNPNNDQFTTHTLDDGNWHIPNRTAGEVLAIFLRDLPLRSPNPLPFITKDFNVLTDSDGTSWSDTDTDWSIPVGTNGLDLLSTCVSGGLFYRVGANMVWHAYEDEPGTDLSASITLSEAVEIAVAADQDIAARETVGRVVVQGTKKSGKMKYREVVNATVEAALPGRREGFVEYKRTPTNGKLDQAGNRYIRKSKRRHDGPLQIAYVERTGAEAFDDFVPGDVVTVDIPGAFNSTALRVYAITLEEDEAGNVTPVVDFEQSPFDPNQGDQAEFDDGPGGGKGHNCADCPPLPPFVPCDNTETGDDVSSGVYLQRPSNATGTIEPLLYFNGTGDASLPGHVGSPKSGLFDYVVETIAGGSHVTGFECLGDGTITVHFEGSMVTVVGAGTTNCTFSILQNGVVVASDTTSITSGGLQSWSTSSVFNTGPIAVVAGDVFKATMDVTGASVHANIVVAGTGTIDDGMFVTGATLNETTHVECVPLEGQTHYEELTGDGSTTSFQTNYPYAPESLEVHVDGLLVPVTETDPTTGTFTFATAPATGAVIIVRYQNAGIVGTGASNPVPTSSTPTGGALTVKDEGTPLATVATSLDFVGAGVTATGSGAAKTVTIPGGISGITVNDEGSPLTTAATSIDFVGTAVVASGATAAKTVTVSAELPIEGGQSVIKAHGSLGSTETFDPTDGNVHTGTLNANCTFTLNAPAGSGACTLELRLAQDGTGGWAITWPGSVTLVGTLDTTASTTAIVILETLDGGTSWVAVVVGSGSTFATPAIALGSSAAAGVATTVIRSDSTIAAFDATAPTTQAIGDSAVVGTAAFAARRDHKHAMPSFGSPVAVSTANSDGVATTIARSDHVHLGSTSSGGASEHAHVAEETHLSDGSTVTWTLDQCYEPGSVIAWNITTLARLLVTEVLPDKATVSAAGTTGDKIVFDYAATLA